MKMKRKQGKRKLNSFVRTKKKTIIPTKNSKGEKNIEKFKVQQTIVFSIKSYVKSAIKCKENINNNTWIIRIFGSNLFPPKIHN